MRCHDWRFVGVFVALLLGAQLLGQTSRPREYHLQSFSVWDLFTQSGGVDKVCPEAADPLRAQLESAQAQGKTVLGAVTSWVFPSFIKAPRAPSIGLHRSGFGEEEVRLNCVPSLGGDEYRTWVGVRDRMYAALAREFPQVEYWLVGYEPNLEVFCDCSGLPLSLEDFVVFAVDTLAGATRAVRSGNPGARTIAHFLGTPAWPIRINGKQVQPAQVIGMIRQEIKRRGGRAEEHFDEFATLFEPALAFDRRPEPPQLVGLGASAASTSPGWNIKWLENFDQDISDIRDLPHWVPWLTNEARVELTPTPASGGLARPYMVQVPGKDWGSIGGARTEGDFVPDQEFPSQHPLLEKDRWTTVLDWFPRGELRPPDAHNPVFLRVNDRECPAKCWYDPDYGIYYNNQTRFGTWVDYTPQGCLQLTGDKRGASPFQGLTKLHYFTLSENPFDAGNSSHLYRNQIIERRYFDWFFPGGWPRAWQAEVWDIPDQQLIGSYGWVSEWTVVYVYRIDVPDLIGPNGDSRVGFGLGPGTKGTMDVERTGTAFWVYP